MNFEDGMLKRLRVAWVVRRALRKDGCPGKATPGRKWTDALLLDAVRGAGFSLPPSERAPAIKEDLVSRVEALRTRTEASAAAEGMGYGELDGKVAPLRGRLITWQRAVLATVIILALLVGLGVASTYAMPGNPLYSVKRFLEDARVFFTPGGESKANARLSSAARRLDELEYVREREMSEWYASLALDAGRDIRASLEKTHALPEEKEAEVQSRAFALFERLLFLLKGMLPEIPSGQAENLRRELEDVHRDLGGSVPIPGEDAREEQEPGDVTVPPVAPPQTPPDQPGTGEDMPAPGVDSWQRPSRHHRLDNSTMPESTPNPRLSQQARWAQSNWT